MAERGLSAPEIPLTPKATRAKITEHAKAIDQARGRDTSQRNPPKKNPPKQNPPLEPQVVVVPVDQAQQQTPHNPQNPPDTNLPPHIPNPPPLSNLPGHIPKPPTQVPDPEQPQEPLPQAPNPVQPPNPPAHVPEPVQPPNPLLPAPNPMQLPNPPAHVPHPMVQQTSPAQVLQLNWSYFKPEFSGKPEEDAEAHLLRTNYWMETHNFPEETKIQRFCLTLTGEARLWYETLKPSRLDRFAREL